MNAIVELPEIVLFSEPYDALCSHHKHSLDNRLKSTSRIASNVLACNETSDITNCNANEMQSWFTQWALFVRRDIVAFIDSESESYDVEMAHLLAVNALIVLVSSTNDSYQRGF